MSQLNFARLKLYKGNIRAPFPDASQLYTEERHHLHYHKQTPGER